MEMRVILLGSNWKNFLLILDFIRVFEKKFVVFINFLSMLFVIVFVVMDMFFIL